MFTLVVRVLPGIHIINSIMDSSHLSPSTALDTGSYFSALASVQDLSGKVISDSKYPVAQGGFSDVWACFWNADSELGKSRCKVSTVVRSTQILVLNDAGRR